MGLPELTLEFVFVSLQYQTGIIEDHDDDVMDEQSESFLSEESPYIADS